MSLLFTESEVNPEMKRRHVWVTAAFDSSYPTGGESFTPSSVGLSTIDRVDAFGARLGYGFEYDASNKKLKVYSGTTEVANATDLTSLSGVKLCIWGS